MKNLFKTLISDFHRRLPISTVFGRELKIPSHSRKIISLTGPRRCGKTFYFFSIINQLITSIPKDRIIYINFEDERLELDTKKLHLLMEAYFELYPDNVDQELFLFFDEIQVVDGWERFVRRIHDTGTYHLFVTGSSARMLSKELATSLRGRNLTFQLFPLSFREYCTFLNIDISDSYSTEGKARLSSTFLSYLKTGGYPELTDLSQEFHTRTLQSYFDSMLFRDIVERYNISNTIALKQFIKKLASTITSEFSIHKFYNEIRSAGISISKNSIYQYLDYVTDCFLFFIVQAYDPSVVRRQARNKKVYLVDNGLLNAITFRFSEDLGKLLENAVYLELNRRGHEIFYYKNAHECDFVVVQNDRVSGVYQVCSQLEDTHTKLREFRSLKKTLDQFNLSQGSIITLEEDTIIKEDSYQFHLSSAWRWFLTSEEE